MSRPETINPIRLEVYRHLFFSIAEEMGTVLKRTAYSPNIKERRDYSCAAFDSGGNLVAMGDHMPVHLGSMPLSVAAAIESAPMIPGDVVIVNDPFSGGTHLPDITMVAPVYSPSPSSDHPLFYVASRAHHSDVGGMTPGSMPLSQEIFQEGLIIPPLKLYEAGNLNGSLLRLLLHNVRTPVEREGDLAAQVGSLRVGEKRILELIRRNGAEELECYVAALQDYSERMVRRLISDIPDGDYSAEDSLDDEGMAERNSRPVKIKVKISVKGDSMRVDFSGTDAQVRGSLNAVRAITVSAVFYIIRCLAPDEVPSTAGLLRPVEILAPRRTVVNASFPCATAGGNVETSQRIVDVLLRALSHALPDRIPAASSGTMNNLALGGIRPNDQQPFSYYETIGGGMGAGPHGDGDNGIHTHMTNSLNTPIEALESQFPLRVREYRLRSDSGGRGKQKGGDGLVRSLEMLTDVRATLLSERRKFAPYGLSGGQAGKKGMNFATLRGRRKKLPGKFTIDMGRGDILTIETPGGGAWGGSERRGPAPKEERPEKKPTPSESAKPSAPPPARKAGPDEVRRKGKESKGTQAATPQGSGGEERAVPSSQRPGRQKPPEPLPAQEKTAPQEQQKEGPAPIEGAGATARQAAPLPSEAPPEPTAKEQQKASAATPSRPSQPTQPEADAAGKNARKAAQKPPEAAAAPEASAAVEKPNEKPKPKPKAQRKKPQPKRQTKPKRPKAEADAAAEADSEPSQQSPESSKGPSGTEQ